MARVSKLGQSDTYLVISRSVGQIAIVVWRTWAWTLAAGLLVVILGVVLSSALARRLADPLSELMRASEALSDGALDTEVSVRSTDEIGKLGRSFNVMARRIESLVGDVRAEAHKAEQASLAKDRFLASISHELRTPLTNVFAYTEILEGMEDCDRSDDEREFLAIIRGQSEHLTQLIDDVMELVAFDAASSKLNCLRFDLQALVAEIAKTLQGEAGPRVVSVFEDKVSLVEGDASKLGAAITKVLKNAVTFTPRAGAVHINAEKRGDEFFVRIADEGPGVADEEKERIFERFYQCGNGLTDKPAGPGLGLAFARDVLAAHGGSITCQDADGGGAEFILRVPLVATPAHEASKAARASSTLV